MKKSKSTAKNILISGYYGFDNFGDEAILGVLVKKLKEIRANITVLSKNPIKTGQLYRVNSTLSFSLLKTVLNIKSGSPKLSYKIGHYAV